MADGFDVYFRRGASNLQAATGALKGYGLQVTHRDDCLVARTDGSQEFRIRISGEPWVREEAVELGANTPHAEAMGHFDMRFECSFDDLDAVLDEINTLMEVQAALQEASGGYLFLPWNGHLSPPWSPA